MRMIDADALRASAMQATETNEVSFSNCFPYWQFSKCIKDAPTIDAVPVVRCCICGKQPPSGFGAVNFCHNCGADMRRESDGST